MFGSRARNLAASTVVAGMLFGSYYLGTTSDGSPARGSMPNVPVQTVADTGNQRVEKERGLFSELAQRLSPTVVHIQVKTRQAVSGSGPFGGRGIPEEFRRFFPDAPTPQVPREGQGQGSGVIISPDGFILTNHHVVKGATQITVVLDDNRELSGKVVGADPKTDIAVVKVESPTPLPAAELGNSDSARIGDWVMAIGNPFGLSHTVTVGVISGKGRVLGGAYDQYLQTDASINPGNSGGPLFDTDGKVVGINTAIISGGAGIGFAVPVNQAREVSQQLRTTGHVTRGFVGLGIQPVDGRMAKALGLPDGTKGALVGSVVPGGPGEKAGIEVGDVVVEFNGKKLADERELLAAVAAAPVGSTAKLTVVREGRTRTLDLKVAQRPADDEEIGMTDTAPGASGIGATVRDLTPALADQLGVGATDGVVVTSVRPGSAAEKAGLRQGDVIRRVGRTPIRNVADFQRLVKQGSDLALLIVREGSQMFLLVERNAG